MTDSQPTDFDRSLERNAMVREQLQAKGITSPRVLQAMRTVPRHAFVPAVQQKNAYADSALPIGSGQTISQPYIVALMSELADPKPGDRVLEIGTGSGYQTAILAEMGARVYSLEILDLPFESARDTLQALRYADHITLIKQDGYPGWPEAAPYDIIMAACAVPEIPPSWIRQLQPQGRMVLPLGHASHPQTLVVVTLDPQGNPVFREVTGVVFVPMTGSFGNQET